MKLFLPIVLGVVCIVLAIAFYETKQGDNAQHETDAGAIGDLSNRLTSAQSQITAQDGTILTLSNSLDQCQSSALTMSNQLVEAKSNLASGQEQLTQLNAKLTEKEAANQALGQQVLDLTNQVTGLSQQLAQTQASLTQTNQNLVQVSKDYLLLENRFRVDVGERTAVERKFFNRAALKTQLEHLNQYPAREVSTEAIYAGLNVEVFSNGMVRVIAPY